MIYNALKAAGMERNLRKVHKRFQPAVNFHQARKRSKISLQRLKRKEKRKARQQRKASKMIATCAENSRADALAERTI